MRRNRARSDVELHPDGPHTSSLLSSFAAAGERKKQDDQDLLHQIPSEIGRNLYTAAANWVP
jgi:hypothetical protein